MQYTNLFQLAHLPQEQFMNGNQNINNAVQWYTNEINQRSSDRQKANPDSNRDNGPSNSGGKDDDDLENFINENIKL